MEVGAVKQAFNNEVILLKKNLNQAKIQTIHKLTRKAKTLTEKNVPEKLKEKFKRKAESAVKEVLIMKKIKPKDIAKFIVTHKGHLQDYLNKPQVDGDKACARLLMHKSMQEKYKVLRDRFSNIQIKDLLMTRQERRKLKKEAREKQKAKNDKKNGKVVNSEGDWDVEDIKMGMENEKLNSGSGDEASCSEKASDNESHDSDEDEPKKKIMLKITDKNDSEDSDQEKPRKKKISKVIKNANSNDANDSDDSNEEEPRKKKMLKTKQNTIIDNKGDSDDSDEEPVNNDDASTSDSCDSDEDKHRKNKMLQMRNNLENLENDDSDEKNSDSEIESGSDEGVNLSVGKFVRPNKTSDIKKKPTFKEKVNKKSENKVRDNKKNKNFNEKILKRKFNKDKKDLPSAETKVVDPFFITSTGENYMSVAEPRQPDEVKEIHKQGNRKLRRAAMFGHVPKIKPKQDSFRHNSYNNQNGFEKKSFNNKWSQESNDRNDFEDRRFNSNSNKPSYNNKPRNNDKPFNYNDKFNKESNEKPEKLHPSWEAKRKQSGILPFQGKKIVFGDS